MKFTFLGTSHGTPSAERFCSCIMLEAGESIYILDAGAPLFDLLLRFGRDPEKVRSIFISHTHGDHVNGLPRFIALMDSRPEYGGVDIHLPEQKVLDAIENLVEAAAGRPLKRMNVRMHAVDETFRYEDENIRLWLIPNGHLSGRRDTYDRPSYSMVIEAEGKRVIYTGDLSTHLRCNDFPTIAIEEPSDLLICEMAHFEMHHVTPYLERCQTKQLCFTHVSGREGRMESIVAAQNDFAYPVVIVRDGDEIVL